MIAGALPRPGRRFVRPLDGYRDAVPAETTLTQLPDRYRVSTLIARGGMAAVWAAEDRVLGRMVAVKVLASHLAEDPAFAERFQREARAAASLSGHPHVITIYDVGEHEGRIFMTMERLTGGSLADVLRRGRVDPAQAIVWLRQAALGLDAAHEHGIVHRDIKPGNLLLDARLRLVIADFGIARLEREHSVTQTGQVFGTAAYIAPEQAAGEPATAASDRYALGVVAYELLTGTVPFGASEAIAQARQHVEEVPPAPRDRAPELPPAVDDVLLRALAKEPHERWPTARGFVDAMERALRGDRRPARPATPAPEHTHVLPVPSPRRRRGSVVAATALLAVAVAVVAVLLPGGGEDSHRSAASRTTTSKRAPAPDQAQAPAQPPAANPAALNAQGFDLMRAGRYGEAIAPLQQSVAACGASNQLDPCGFALYNLGRSLRLAGRPAQAIPFLQRRLQIPNQLGVVKQELRAARREARGD